MMTHALAYVVYGPTITGIFGINPVTGTASKVYTFGTSLTSIAAIAQRQSDGVIFFIDGNTGNNNVYRWDPSTPATAPVLLGTTGSGVPYLPRLGFNPNTGVLYAMDTNANPTIWTINQSTGAATSTGMTVSGLPSGGGDFVIDTDGSVYIAVATTLYKTSTLGGTLATVGTIASSTNITGIALGAGSNLVGVDSSVPSKIYTISKANASTTSTGQTISDGSNSVGDLAGIFEPDLQLTKTDDGPWTASLPGVYTLTLTNIGNQTTSGTMTLSDPVPSGITVNSVSAPSGWTCTTAQTVTCTSNAGTTMAANATATFTINITVSGSQTTVTNSATLTGGGVPANLAIDGQASDTTSISQSVATNLYVGPYDSTDANLGSQYTGSFNGVATASDLYDFTARMIPFPNGTALVNTSTTPGSPSGAAVTATSVTIDVPNSLYFNNGANGTRNATIQVTAPSGWTAQVCPDNGSGAALCSGSTVGACTGTAWQVGAAAQTSSSVCSQLRRSTGNTRFWVRYTTPASGLTALTRYDAVIEATDTAGDLNTTHNELYSGFVAITKWATVVTTGCPSSAPASSTCPGGILKYTIDYRNIVAGAGLGTEGTVLALFPVTKAGQLTIADNGLAGGTTANWANFSNGLMTALTAGTTGATCGSGGTCGDSQAASVCTGAAGATQFSCQIGGATFQLYPANWAGQVSSGTITFAVKIK